MGVTYVCGAANLAVPAALECPHVIQSDVCALTFSQLSSPDFSCEALRGLRGGFLRCPHRYGAKLTAPRVSTLASSKGRGVEITDLITE